MKTLINKISKADIHLKIVYIIMTTLLLLNITFANNIKYGEKILEIFNLPIYSNGNYGLYFPGILYLIALTISYIYLKKLYKDNQNKEIWNLVLFQVVLVFIMELVFKVLS